VKKAKWEPETLEQVYSMLVFSMSLIHSGESKVFLVYTMKAYWGNTSTAPLISNPGVTCRWMGNFKTQPFFPVKNPCTWASDLIWTFPRLALGPTQPPCTIGIGSFPRVKWSGHRIHHPHPSSVEVKEIVELYLYSPSGHSWSVIGLLYRAVIFQPLALICLYI
jgi:hypothetical protein